MHIKTFSDAHQTVLTLVAAPKMAIPPSIQPPTHPGPYFFKQKELEDFEKCHNPPCLLTIHRKAHKHLHQLYSHISPHRAHTPHALTSHIKILIQIHSIGKPCLGLLIGAI